MARQRGRGGRRKTGEKTREMEEQEGLKECLPHSFIHFICLRRAGFPGGGEPARGLDLPVGGSPLAVSPEFRPKARVLTGRPGFFPHATSNWQSRSWEPRHLLFSAIHCAGRVHFHFDLLSHPSTVNWFIIILMILILVLVLQVTTSGFCCRSSLILLPLLSAIAHAHNL